MRVPQEPELLPHKWPMLEDEVRGKFVGAIREAPLLFGE